MDDHALLLPGHAFADEQGFLQGPAPSPILRLTLPHPSPPLTILHRRCSAWLAVADISEPTPAQWFFVIIQGGIGVFWIWQFIVHLRKRR